MAARPGPAPKDGSQRNVSHRWEALSGIERTAKGRGPAGLTLMAGRPRKTQHAVRGAATADVSWTFRRGCRMPLALGEVRSSRARGRPRPAGTAFRSTRPRATAARPVAREAGGSVESTL
jgi:hypothetical protein